MISHTDYRKCGHHFTGIHEMQRKRRSRKQFTKRRTFWQSTTTKDWTRTAAQDSQRRTRSSRESAEQDRVHVSECLEASSGILSELVSPPIPTSMCHHQLPKCRP